MARHGSKPSFYSYLCMTLITQVTALPPDGRVELLRLLQEHKESMHLALTAVCAHGDSHVAGVMVKVRPLQRRSALETVVRLTLASCCALASRSSLTWTYHGRFPLPMARPSRRFTTPAETAGPCWRWRCWILERRSAVGHGPCRCRRSDAHGLWPRRCHCC